MKRKKKRIKKPSQPKQQATPAPASADIGQLLTKAIEDHQQSRLVEAEAGYRKILEITPDHADANHLLGVIAYQVGKLGMAEKLITKAIQTDPHQPNFHLNLGNVLQDLNRAPEAMASYGKALEINPDFPEAHNNVGNALKNSGDLKQAILHFGKAIELRPTYAEAHNNLGNALNDINKPDEAIPHLRRAVEINDGYIEAYNNLARALSTNGEHQEAADWCRKTITLAPDFIDAHINLGVILLKMGQTEECLAICQNAVTLAPDNPATHVALANVLRTFGRFDEALASYNQALDLKPDHEEAHSNKLMTLHYAANTQCEDLYSAAIRWAAPYNEPLPIRPQANERQGERPLRIGYVSADFNRHPIGFYLDRILPFHTSDKFEIVCYSNNRKTDDVTERLRAATILWRDVVGVSDQKMAQQIREDKIDILVDLSGHTAGNRLSVFAMRPAPVQVTWMGYTGTTGLKAMDFILADTFVLPEHEQEYFTETVKYLPGSYLCFDPPRVDLSVEPPPVTNAGHITFGSFNNRIKITPEAIAVWSNILKAVSGSQILLKTTLLDDAGVRQSVLEQFQANGIDEDRVMLEGRSPRDELLKAYQRIDIALDTLPYGGGVTTAEAIWMGVPVISLRSERWSGRLGETILNAIGVPELVAENRDQYCTMAIDLAQDSPRLEAYYRDLRDLMEISAFCDGPAFASKLEQAYEEMWAAYIPENTATCGERTLSIDDGYNEAVAHQQNGQTAEAEEIYRLILEVDVNHTGALHNLGVIIMDQGNLEEALSLFDKSISLAPDIAPFHNSRGVALFKAGRIADAIKAYRKSTSINPNNPQALRNIGTALREINKPAKALVHFQEALEQDPEDTNSLNGAGAALLDLNQPEKAAPYFQKVLKRHPDFAEVHYNLGNAYKDMGQFDESISSYSRTIELKPDFELAHSNKLVTLHYAPSTTTKDLFTTASDWAAGYNANIPVVDFPNIPDPERRLRVGYVSADFSKHPVGFYLCQILPFHNNSTVDLFAYSNSKKVDSVTDLLKKNVTAWHDVLQLSDQEVAQQIKEDEIDILIDLSGHTQGNRLGVFALRPAPIQITWMGYTGTTGLKTMDYILADQFVLPEHEKQFFSEAVAYLPGCYLCFDPPDFDIPTVPPPARKAGYITFGSFNNRIKITPEAIASWASILKTVDGSRMFLKTALLDSKEARQILIDQFQAHGISADRIELEGRSVRKDLLAAYQRVDIILDSHPFGGGVTTVEALWMGVPVIVLRNDRWSGRLGETILKAVGLAELVADSPELYHNLAIELANDLPRLDKLHDELRTKIISSPFCDGPAFTRKLEDAYCEMWRTWCAKRKTT